MEISAIADSGSTISNGAMMLAGAQRAKVASAGCGRRQSSTVLRSTPASRVRNAPGTAPAGKARWSFPFWKRPPGGAHAKFLSLFLSLPPGSAARQSSPSPMSQ